MNSKYRLDYYEDDVVTYTCKGKHPVIPDKYKYCRIPINKNKVYTYKSFYNNGTAEAALRAQLCKKYDVPYYFIGSYLEPYIIFQCKKCGLYHIMTKKIYNKYCLYKPIKC